MSHQRKREGDDLYNNRGSPSRRWESSESSISASIDLARQLEQQRRQNALLPLSARLAAGDFSSSISQPAEEESYRPSARDRLDELSRLRQEISIQERLLQDAVDREERLRRLQQASRIDLPYYGGATSRAVEPPETAASTNLLVERIRRLERELELSRVSNLNAASSARGGGLESAMGLRGTTSSLLSGGASRTDLFDVRTTQEAERALQRMISLREEDPRQRLLDELRLRESLVRDPVGSSSLRGLGGRAELSSGAIGGGHASSLVSSHHSNALLHAGREAARQNNAESRKSAPSRTKERAPTAEPPVLSGPSFPVVEDKVVSMTLPTDATSLSKYQATIRSGLEFFTANQADAMSVVQGRKKRIRLYQVGIRCKYCAKLPLKDRSTGAVYFPASLGSVYQAAQNVASVHMLAERKTKTGACSLIPSEFQKELEDSKNVKAGSLVGKQYWADSCVELGIAEEYGGLWFPKSLNGDSLEQQDNTGAEQAEEKKDDEEKKEEEESDEELCGRRDDDEESNDDEQQPVKACGSTSAV